MFDSTRKQTSCIAQFQVHQSLRSCGGGIPEEGTESDHSLLLSTSDDQNRRKRPSGRPVEDRSAGWSLLEGQRSVPFPPEHYFKGESTAHQRELRRKEEGGTLVTYHRSKSSPLKLNSCCSVCLAFLSRKEVEKTRIIHRALCATRPHTVRSGLSRLWGEKCTRERGGGKRTAFLPPPFSSLRFQAAVQLCGSLLQATPAPTEPTGWSSSALQSQKPTAGS